MRIALCQLNLAVGDLEANAERMLVFADAAAREGADLAIFPEQSIAGYPAEDLLLKRHFLDRCQDTLDIVARAMPLPALVGFPELDDDVYNSCAVIVDRAVAGIYRKQHLPNYGVFDEHRYFREGKEPALIHVGDVVVGLTICEDIWLPTGPANAETAAGAHVILNLSASPYRRGRGLARERMLATRAADGLAYMVLCNQVGGQDELVFDGHSVVVDHTGEVVARAAQFREELLICDLDIEQVIAARLHDTRHRAVSDTASQVPVIAHFGTVAKTGQRGGVADKDASSQKRGNGDGEPRVCRNSVPELLDPLAEVYEALLTGLRDYVAKNGFKSVIVGLSGGIDSAIVVTLAADALGADRVHALTMPSRYSSDGTRSDAHATAEALGIEIDELAIEPVFSAFLDLLSESFQGREADVTEENLQARIRGILLMALSNKFGHLVLTTGNKSEVSVGYMTLYGDMAGGFAPIKDVQKTLVYELARWRNAQAAERGQPLPIPASVIDRPPTAELREGQKDSDSLPPYEVLDPLLEQIIEHDAGKHELIEAGYSSELIDRVSALVDRAEYKRRQAPPGIRISAKAFGRDRRMPITNRFLERVVDSAHGRNA